MSKLGKAYEPKDVEGPLYEWWEKQGFFHAEPDADGQPYSIVIPPPNVTGSLHVGHALDNTLQDALIRRARMRGLNAVWLPGTDHAGIATQNVVERQLASEGISRHDLGREAFIERVWQWREESGGVILQQLRRLGASCDWEREAFTFDEQRSRAVREVFVTLHEQGLIYRGYRLINWCPRCLSALSDIEVDHIDEPGELAYLRYPQMDGGDGVVVATTRAETMLGDTGVAVHPDDERYRHLVGTTLRLPLLDRELPVVADDHVDPAFGTGAVKVTPAHDPNDYEIGQRHGLETIDIMTDEAAISAAGGPYAGLDRFAARERVKADLDALGLLVRVEQRVHSVGHCSRCGTVVEPRLSDQWFVNVGPLASKAIEAVRDGRTRFVPERNAKGFLNWLENLHDWCISRQLWWGHRIPAWYDAEGHVHVLREDPTPEDEAERGLVRDPDVLDTWFSSALWPFTTMGWPDRTPELETWYPTSVLVTGYDINTFWVSRMLMMGLHFMGGVEPFGTVFNHGMVRDRHGKKMSKSFGNTIDPLDLIDEYGADALRFALIRAATLGQDVPLAEEWVEGARRFANKLWNAANLVLLLTGDEGPALTAEGPPAAGLALEDRWILSRLEAARAAVDEDLDGYDFAGAARSLYHFIWDEYCDWYLELAKLREDRESKRVLLAVLDAVLRLLHPLMPFVTEEIWRTLCAAHESDSLVVAAWPSTDPARRDLRAETEFDALRDVVTELRRFRADHRLPTAARIDVIAVAPGERRTELEAGLDGIRRLSGVGQWIFADDPSRAAGGPLGKVPVTGADLFVPLAGLLDLDEERERLTRELDKAKAELARAEGKLANAGFVD
ncbi:MAG TPA: valine--tRNA ligase, partial [Egibacteraceae bacterium]|nr:valine--tRNA ligase [Egibacteraceae bacterium]